MMAVFLFQELLASIMRDGDNEMPDRRLIYWGNKYKITPSQLTFMCRTLKQDYVNLVVITGS